MSATRVTKKAASPATKPHEENRGKSVWVEAPDGSVGRRQPGWEDAPEPEAAPAQVKPTRKPRTPAKKVATPSKARATRKPTKSGDPRADRAAATKKAEAVTARAAKAATPKAKPVTKKAATPSNGLEAALIKKGWTVALTRNQAIAAYCKQRTLLHGAGPEAYRKATAKALGISDEAFLAAFYAPKTEGKASE